MSNAATILIVDDEPEILEILRDSIEGEDYRCLLAADSEEALAVLEHEPIDLVLSDIRMPGMDGMELLKQVAKRWPKTLRMTQSGYGVKEDVINALNQGHIHAYFSKPWDFDSLKHRMESALRIRREKVEQGVKRKEYIQLVTNQRDEVKHLFRSLTDAANDSIIVLDENEKITYWNRQAEVMFGFSKIEVLGQGIRHLLIPQSYMDDVGEDDLRTIWSPKEGQLASSVFETLLLHRNGKELAVELTVSSVKQGSHMHTMAIVRDISERKQAEIEKERHSTELREAMISTIQVIGTTVEKRDPYTAGHQNRVARIATAIAAELGLSKYQVEGIKLGSAVHDIGKIHIPAALLNRPGRLTDGEFSIIKSHPEVGYDIMKDIEFPWPIAKMIRQHHERLDGSGYPDGLQGEDIILEAQIIAVADIVEAITSHRPYRPALGVDVALQAIQEQKGSLLNPDVVEACQSIIETDGFEIVCTDLS